MNEDSLLISEQGNEPETITPDSLTTNETQTETIELLINIDNNLSYLNNQFYVLGVLLCLSFIISILFKTLKNFY